MKPIQSDRLDLNNANRKLLTQLPGVSKYIAYRIINYRKRHGGFADWSDVESAFASRTKKWVFLRHEHFLVRDQRQLCVSGRSSPLERQVERRTACSRLVRRVHTRGLRSPKIKRWWDRPLSAVRSFAVLHLAMASPAL